MVASGNLFSFTIEENPEKLIFSRKYLKGGTMEPSTIIGEDIDFKGSLKFKNGLKIRGKLQGTIETDGVLYIDDGSEVKADIHTGSAVINGSVTGNIIASKRVEIKSHGQIRGDIKTPEIQIVTGAKFTGACRMD